MKQQQLVTAVVTTAGLVAFSGSAIADVLYDNGPLVTIPGGGFDGADASVLQTGQTTLGVAHDETNDFRVSDDFGVSGPDGWTIDTITFFAYQTGSTTTSTMTGVNLRIWDGPPGEPGSTVVFGDTTTNRLQSSSWSGIYRTAGGDPLAANRPIMANVVEVGMLLPQGAYWLDWQTDGTLASGPWAPPITVAGATTTGNATQSGDGTIYTAILDGGSNTALGFPFIIEGTGKTSACDGDTNGDGLVNVTDLVNVINTWGTDGQGADFDADLNGDGVVDVTDLVNGVINNWGPCTGALRACCTEIGGCNEIAELDCAISGGLIQAPLSSCTEGVLCADQTGACCFPSLGTCETLLPSECGDAAGVHQGGDSSCASGICDPDSNDLCAGAEMLDISGGPAEATGQTVTATDDPPAFECPETNTVDAPGNWYTVTGTGTLITATLCDGTDYDAKIHVYCGDDCGSLTCLAGDDDGCGIVGGPSETSWCSEAGRNYYIFVAGWGGNVGNYTLLVSPGGGCGDPTPCQDSEDICLFALDILPGETVTVDTSNASLDLLAPDCGGGGQNGAGVWLKGIGDGTRWTVELCSAVLGSINTRLSVYCGPCDELDCVDLEPSNNASCDPFTEQLTFCSEIGTEYLILVSGAGPGDTGVIDVTLTSAEACTDIPCQCPECPVNDDCENAIPIELGMTDFDTSLATPDGPPLPDPGCDEGFGVDFAPDIWFIYTPPTDGLLTVSTCSMAEYDTRLAAYAASSACDEEAVLACNDDGPGCTGFTSLMVVPVSEGVAVRLRVGGFATATGAGTLELTLE